MSPTVIKDFKIKQSYTRLVQRALFSYLREGIYKPMFEILDIKPDKAGNSIDTITEALKSGQIYYADGGFRAKTRFTAAQSRELLAWGAKYDSRQKAYKIDYNQIPDTVRVALAQSEIRAQDTIRQLEEFLKEVEANIPYIVESMVFNEEVVTILDDAGNEVKKNVKHLNVIEPELSEAQKQEIARSYTNNMRFYIKNLGESLERSHSLSELFCEVYQPINWRKHNGDIEEECHKIIYLHTADSYQDNTASDGHEVIEIPHEAYSSLVLGHCLIHLLPGSLQPNIRLIETLLLHLLPGVALDLPDSLDRILCFNIHLCNRTPDSSVALLQPMVEDDSIDKHHGKRNYRHKRKRP